MVSYGVPRHRAKGTLCSRKLESFMQTGETATVAVSANPSTPSAPRCNLRLSKKRSLTQNRRHGAHIVRNSPCRVPRTERPHRRRQLHHGQNAHRSSWFTLAQPTLGGTRRRTRRSDKNRPVHLRNARREKQKPPLHSSLAVGEPRRAKARSTCAPLSCRPSAQRPSH